MMCCARKAASYVNMGRKKKSRGIEISLGKHYQDLAQMVQARDLYICPRPETRHHALQGNLQTNYHT